MDNIEEKSFEYSSSNDYSSLNEEAPSAVDGKDKISGVVERVVFSNEEGVLGKTSKADSLFEQTSRFVRQKKGR